MDQFNLQFAAETSGGGISSLGINLKGFIFQLITFLLVFMILRKYVFPRLVATMEKRREALEQSLIQAKKTEEALANAEKKAAELLAEARKQADGALDQAQKKAEQIIAKAETDSEERAKRIMEDAKQQLSSERQKLHDQLRGELAELVIKATEKVLSSKVDTNTDKALVERSLEEVSR